MKLKIPTKNSYYAIGKIIWHKNHYSNGNSWPYEQFILNNKTVTKLDTLCKLMLFWSGLEGMI